MASISDILAAVTRDMSQMIEQPRLAADRRYHGGEEWLADLGNIPINRGLSDPWPGTATEKDLLHYVEVENRLRELVNGTLVEEPTGYWQGRIAMSVGRIVGNFVVGRRAGAITGPDTTMRMKSSRRSRMPDEMLMKRRECFASITRLAWMVDPRSRSVAFYAEPEQPARMLTEADTLKGGDVLPGFVLSVAEISSELPRDSA